MGLTYTNYIIRSGGGGGRISPNAEPEGGQRR